MLKGFNLKIEAGKTVALVGSFRLRVARSIKSPVTAAVVVIESRDGDKSLDSAIMVSCDLAVVPEDLTEIVRDKIAKLVPELDVRKIFLSATHTHAAPCSRLGKYDVPKDVIQPEEYREFFAVRVSAAIAEAWKTRHRLQRRGPDGAWSPVDYAPHAWRVAEEELLGRELQFRSGAAFNADELAGNLNRNPFVGNAQVRFEPRSDSQLGFRNDSAEEDRLKALVQLKNDLLLRAVAGEDIDGDGLEASEELVAGASPFRRDTDGDGLEDDRELAEGTDPTREDSDEDGVSDAAEVSGGTQPLVADTDGDGLVDGRDGNPLYMDVEGVHYVHPDHLGGTAPNQVRSAIARARVALLENGVTREDPA